MQVHPQKWVVPCGWTDTHNEANSHCHNFGNVTKKCIANEEFVKKIHLIHSFCSLSYHTSSLF